MWVPEGVWNGLSEGERAAWVERQRALLEPSPASTQPPGRAALDQMTTARPLQLALFGA
jgi:hypothetical protein